MKREGQGEREIGRNIRKINMLLLLLTLCTRGLISLTLFNDATERMLLLMLE